MSGENLSNIPQRSALQAHNFPLCNLITLSRVVLQKMLAKQRGICYNYFVCRTKGERFAVELNIVLVEPQIPQNTGNISRTCAVTGARLHLVKPMGFEVTDKNLKRAGLDYWKYLDISYYDGLSDFFAKNEGSFFYFSTKAQNCYCDVSYPEKCYLVFGREDAGLPEELLFSNRESCVRIPMLPTLRSLNLSNSVAIAAYEVLRQRGFEGLSGEGRLTQFDWSDCE